MNESTVFDHALALNKSRHHRPFFAWVYQLERLSLSSALATKTCVMPMGQDGPVGKEAIQFVGNYALSPVSAAASLLPNTHDTKNIYHKIKVNFVGLAGVMGVLPTHYTALIARRIRQKDCATAEFMDVFFHRLMGLYCRAWFKYRLPYQVSAGGVTPVEQLLQAFGGDNTSYEDTLRLYYTTYFQQSVRSTHGLRQMLTELVGSPVQIKEFVGRWKPLDVETRTRLVSSRAEHIDHAQPLSHQSSGFPSVLGQGVNLGRRWWDASAGIAIHLGPLVLAQYRLWQKGSQGLSTLKDLVRAFVPTSLEVSVYFHVDRRTLVGAQLGQRKRLGVDLVLGRSVQVIDEPHTVCIRVRLNEWR